VLPRDMVFFLTKYRFLLLAPDLAEALSSAMLSRWTVWVRSSAGLGISYLEPPD
jgi:hypothetical protein